jgi:hypothetical protein
VSYCPSVCVRFVPDVKNNIYVLGIDWYNGWYINYLEQDMRIDKNVKIESQNRNNYPFSKMDIGDSIFFEGSGYRGRPHEAAKKYFERNGGKISCRKSNQGIRIWRVA